MINLWSEIIKALKSKLCENYEKKTVMSNISYESYLKIKNFLLKNDNNQFYCYQNDMVGYYKKQNYKFKLSDFTQHSFRTCITEYFRSNS